MKKISFCLLLFFAIASPVFTQNLDWEDDKSANTDTNFLVWSVTGKVTTTDENNQSVSVTEGMDLPNNAKVTVEKGAALSLIADNKLLPALKKAKTYNLSEIDMDFADPDGAVMSDVWAGVNMAAKGHGGGGLSKGKGHGGGGLSKGKGHGGGGLSKGKGHGGGGLSKGKGHGGGGLSKGKGHGSANITIFPISPLGNGVPSGNVKFEWTKNEKENAIYQFTIFSSNSATPIFSALTPNNFFEVDMSNLVITLNDNIKWQVNTSLVGGNAPEVWNNFIEKGAEQSVLDDLKKTEVYQSSDDYHKQLLEAVVLADANLSYQANERYKNALTNDNNELSKKMYRVFLEENGWEYLLEKSK